MADPNPCRTPACIDMSPRPLPIVDTPDPNFGVARVRCPNCYHIEWGDDRADAIAEWNAMNPRPSRWPWCLAAAIVLAAFIGGAING